MSSDRDLLRKYYSRRDRSASNEQERIVITNNSEKNRLLREVPSKIDREAMTVKRQDVDTYQLTFEYFTQAVSIIIGFFLILTGLVFQTVRVPMYLSQLEVMSWVLFGEAGFLMIIASLSIPRRSVTFKTRNINKGMSQNTRNLIFAYTHTLSWFTASVCIAIISTIIFMYG